MSLPLHVRQLTHVHESFYTHTFNPWIIHTSIIHNRNIRKEHIFPPKMSPRVILIRLKRHSI